jgi:hypothetical protein
VPPAFADLARTVRHLNKGNGGSDDGTGTAA